MDPWITLQASGIWRARMVSFGPETVEPASILPGCQRSAHFVEACATDSF